MAMKKKDDHLNALIDALMESIPEQKVYDQSILDGRCHELIFACEKKSAADVETILKEGINPNFTLSRGTPLTVATHSDFDAVEKVLLLIRFTADVNLISYDLLTPLACAAVSNRADVVRILLNAGANIDDQRNSLNWTALMFSACHGSLESSYELVNHGADTSLLSEHNLTAIDIAVANGHHKLAKLIRVGGKN